MPLSVLTAPESLPISVIEVREAARVEHSEDDVRLYHLIESAVAYARDQHGIACLTQTMRYTQMGRASWRYYPEAVLLPVRPVVSIESITITDRAGDDTVLDADDYDAAGGHLSLRRYPTTGETVSIDFTAGYGASADDVPAALRQGLIQMVVDAYAAGTSFVVGTVAARLPVEDLLAPYKLLTV